MRKKNMRTTLKKMTAGLLAAAMVFSLTACKEAKPDSKTKASEAADSPGQAASGETAGSTGGGYGKPRVGVCGIEPVFYF